MKIALVQTNPVIGAFAENCDRILAAIDQARAAGCDLAVFPELALCGYPPRDLLERSAFLDAHDRALARLIDNITGIGCILGVLERRTGPGRPLFNSAFLIDGGRVCYRARKQLLPTYDVFDECRYFEPGSAEPPFVFKGMRLGLFICEDIWQDSRRYQIAPVTTLFEKDMAPDIIINISASPYYHGKIGQRLDRFGELCRQHQVGLVYVNQVGGQDELIFDGHSLVLDQKGRVWTACKGFAEDMAVFDTDGLSEPTGAAAPRDSIAQVCAGLVLGLRDYCLKTGFSRVLLGLSGGIDSAVTAAIACLALGPENVQGLAMPSPYTARMSVDDARDLAANLGCGFTILPIEPAMDAFAATLAPLFAGLADDVTEQNLQARIRGTLLMAVSNKLGHLLLSTGNKSEMAVGYCTLYGDMNGGLAVLADVPKVMVYELARYLNRDGELIPERIITRAPSAELKPDQTDQDDLPPYEVLDAILQGYLEEGLGVPELVEQGFAEPLVRDVVRRIKRNEYKRRQAPIGLKVTSKAFGQGRRYPVAHRFED